MLAYLLAILVGIGSLTLYMSAFFFPEVHRRGDFIWSGIGLFYALILWLCAGRITGAVLLGETAGVSLLLWFGSQTLLLRRDLTPVLEKTPVNSTEIAEKTSKFSGLFPKSSKQKKNVTKGKDSPADQVATVGETVRENMVEIATAVSDQIPTVTAVSDSLSGLAEQAVDTAENLGNELSKQAGAITSNIATNTEEIAQVAEEKLTSVGEVVGVKIEEVLPTKNPADQLVENIKTRVDEWGEPIPATEQLVENIDKTVDEWGEVIGEKAESVTTSVTKKTEGAIANIQEKVKPEKKSAGFARVLKPVSGFFNNFRKGNKLSTTSNTDEKLAVNNLSETLSEVSEKVTDVIVDKTDTTDNTVKSVKSVDDNIINNLTQNLNKDLADNSPVEKDIPAIDNTMQSDKITDAGIEKEIVVFEELFDQGDDSLSAEDEVIIASIDNPFQANETIEEIASISDNSDIPSSDILSSVKEIIEDQLNNGSNNDANPTEETTIVLEGISEVVTESVTTTVEKMDNDLIKAVQVTTTEVEVIYSQVADVNSNVNNTDDTLDSALGESKSENTENI